MKLTKAGVYTGCSFEFYPKAYDIEERRSTVSEIKVIHKELEYQCLHFGYGPSLLADLVACVNCMNRLLKAKRQRRMLKKQSAKQRKRLWKRQQPVTVRCS